MLRWAEGAIPPAWVKSLMSDADPGRICGGVTCMPLPPSSFGIGPVGNGKGPMIARRGLVVVLFVLGAASCSRLPVDEVTADGNGPTTTYVTTPPTSAPITSAPSTTQADQAVPTTAVPTTAVPTTAAPTTAAPTTVAETTSTTASTADQELEELPYTGPSEAVLFALIGLTMVVAGRSVLDLSGVLSRFGRAGRELPPR